MRERLRFCPRTPEHERGRAFGVNRKTLSCAFVLSEAPQLPNLPSRNLHQAFSRKGLKLKNELIPLGASSASGKATPIAGTAACDAAFQKSAVADGEVPLGTRLRDLRKQLGLSQAKFAEALGCTRRTLLTYETLRREPPFRIIREAARLSDLSIDELALGAEGASRYRVRAWQQAESLKQRLIEMATLQGISLEMDSDRWNRVMQILLMNGARIGANERLLEIFLILQCPDKPTAPDIGELQ